MESNQEDTSRTTLKIVLILSLLLVTMDIYEFYFTYDRLIDLSVKFEPKVYEDCVKYHLLSQMFFTMFATFSGISATIMSFGLLINYDFFTFKFIETFLYFNYLIFGPYLLACCCLGFYNFSIVAFDCDIRDHSKKYLNFSTLLALIICCLLSFFLTIGVSSYRGYINMLNSIRFRPNGSYIVGRLFWRYIFNRARESIRINEGMENNELEEDLENPQVRGNEIN